MVIQICPAPDYTNAILQPAPQGPGGEAVLHSSQGAACTSWLGLLVAPLMSCTGKTLVR